MCRLLELHIGSNGRSRSFGIRSIIEDSQGYYWVCNTNYRYTFKDSILVSDEINFLDYNKEKNSFSIDESSPKLPIYFLSIIEDDNKNIWMVTYDDGVYRYDGKKLDHYPLISQGRKVLAFTIYKDITGDIWIGTHNAGIMKLDVEGFIRVKTF